jgi:5-methylcytosine-specific restriction endonuclease McrA
VNPYDELTPAQRRRRLRRGDHSEYELYLRSRPWRALRARLIVARGGACERCGRDYLVVLEVHHRSYRRIGRELDSDLQVLCASCHELADRQRRAA